MTRIRYERTLELKRTYDVLVAGAGPAGICAAVSAARQGASVALIERYGVLGGNLTVGFVGPILGMVSGGTMRDELVHLLGVPENDMLGWSGRKHDMEQAKIVIEEFVAREKNIDVYMQSTVCDAIMEQERITGLVIAGNEEPYILGGKIVIDATGDANVCVHTGCAIKKGRESDGLMQPVSLEFTIDGVDEEKGVVCVGDVDPVKLNGVRFLDYCKQCSEQGLLPERLAAVRLHPTVYSGERQVNTTQQNGVDMTQTEQIFSADVQLRRQIRTLVQFFREHLPGYENCKCIASGDTTGVRESRRVIGDYVITAEELAVGCRFEDVIVHKAEFIVDIHNPAGAGQVEETIQYCKPYDLPYRCFIPKGVTNLYTAGRCISGTHRAHASYRVMSICMAMGEAVGAAAALCAERNCDTRALPVRELQDALEKRGVDLFSE